MSQIARVATSISHYFVGDEFRVARIKRRLVNEGKCAEETRRTAEILAQEINHRRKLTRNIERAVAA